MKMARSAKAQSAIEFLTTYGWAILVIGVVAIALVQLGVFKGSTFEPRAAAGTCKVVRPNGPLTTQFMDLEGSCNNEWPQYVANYTAPYVGCAAGFNGTQITSFQGTFTSMTVAFWATSTQGMTIVSLNRAGGGGCTGGWGLLQYRGNTQDWYVYNSVACISVPDAGISGKQLSFHALVLNSTSGTAMSYTNGALSDTLSPWSGTIPSVASLELGGLYPGCQDNYRGLLSNVQIYNAALPANDIYTLYKEGIGGAPVDLNYLVGWWPMNGDANDYSGNNYNPSSLGSGTFFTSSWTDSYVQP